MDTNTVPYDDSNPIFYDNDDHRDVYTDEFLLALASAGRIELRGLSTTYAYDQTEYDEFVRGRKQIVERARASGMSSIPDPLTGPDETLTEPESGEIGDTEVIGTESTEALVEAAKAASSEQPLVVITGGPLTVVADAFLHDPSIVESVVVSSLLGTFQDTSMWNGELDPWATYIVTTQFEYVQFPTNQWPATVRKGDLARRLPTNPLTEWMVEKSHPTNQLPEGADHDGQPAIPLVRSEYVKAGIKCSVGARANGICYFGDDPDGNITVILQADGHGVGQLAFFQALTDPSAYTG